MALDVAIKDIPAATLSFASGQDIDTVLYNFGGALEADLVGNSIGEFVGIGFDAVLSTVKKSVDNTVEKISEAEIAKLKNTVITEGQMLKDIGLSNDQLGPAIAGAYDRTTGKIYTAINDYDGFFPKEIAPIIKERIDIMPMDIELSYLCTKGVGSHAEIYAVNKLLLDNPNARIEDIVVYVNRTLGTSKPVIEVPFKTCPHCRYILDGFNIISDK